MSGSQRTSRSNPPGLFGCLPLGSNADNQQRTRDRQAGRQGELAEVAAATAGGGSVPCHGLAVDQRAVALHMLVVDSQVL